MRCGQASQGGDKGQDRSAPCNYCSTQYCYHASFGVPPSTRRARSRVTSAPTDADDHRCADHRHTMSHFEEVRPVDKGAERRFAAWDDGTPGAGSDGRSAALRASSEVGLT